MNKKLIISLGIAMLVNVANSTKLYGMQEKSIIKVPDKFKEFLNEYLNLPEELRKEVWVLMKYNIIKEEELMKNYLQLPRELQRQIQLIETSASGNVIAFLLASNIHNTDTTAFKWIIDKASVPQLNFIKRAYDATITGQDLIIALPGKINKVKENESQEQKDGGTYFSFPDAVREYLRNRLNIKK